MKKIIKFIAGLFLIFSWIGLAYGFYNANGILLLITIPICLLGSAAFFSENDK